MDTLRPLPSDLVELRNLRSLLGDLRHQLAASIADADHRYDALTSLFKHKRFSMDLAGIVIGETTPPPAILRMDELVPYLPPAHTQFVAEFLRQAGQREQLRGQRELDLAMSDELDGLIAGAVAAGVDGDDARRTLARLFSYHGHERDLAELSVGLSTVREAIIALENRVCHELDARATRKTGAKQSEGDGNQAKAPAPAKADRPPTKAERQRKQRLDFCRPRRRTTPPETWDDIYTEYRKRFPKDTDAGPDALRLTFERWEGKYLAE